ncbi:MAG TPA: amino acid permease [Flavisolibacter sp.]|nr:amino acid permease [Flavisolibacter sp.]
MQPPQLQRKLGLWACISIVAGSVIGSSIFMKPATMAAQLGSPALLLVVWTIAGIVSIFGGMINAEIGTMLPQTGGQYVYFRHMYGRFFAYLYGWAGFIVINTAAIAAIAFIAAQYTTYFIPLPHFSGRIEQSFVCEIPFVGRLFPLENLGVKSLAIGLVIIFTLINHRSVKAGGNVQVLFTVLKVSALLFLILAVLFSGKGSVKNFVTAGSAMDFSSWGVVTGFVAATSGALAAYDGWNNMGFVGGEIKDPQKNIPRGLIWGLVICIILYILTTLAYLYLLPVDVMKTSKLVATDALLKVMGGGGASIIALMVIISATGAINGNILPCARITYAMAKDGLFFSWGATVDGRHHTPSAALWLQCFVSCLFIVSGSFDMLADLFVFVSWLFYGFAAFGIFILRKKMPGAQRPYKLKGYPLIPIVFILFAAFYFVITVYNDIHNYMIGQSRMINAALGLLLLLTGVPFYWWFRQKYKS